MKPIRVQSINYIRIYISLVSFDTSMNNSFHLTSYPPTTLLVLYRRIESEVDPHVRL